MRISLLLAVLATITWNLTDSPNKSAADHKDAITQQAPANPSPVTVVVHNSQGSEPAQPTKPETPSGNTSPEWALVFVGIVTCAFIGWQAWETRKSAEAAKNSVAVLIVAERAWVTVSVSWAPDYPGLFNSDRIEHGNVTKRRHYAQIRMIYKNEGRTPAWISERRACLKVTADMSLPANPPLQDTEIVAYGPESLAAGQEKWFDTPLESKGRQTMDNIALVFGVVRYRTAFKGLTGETLFGYDVAFGGKSLRQLEAEGWNTHI